MEVPHWEELTMSITRRQALASTAAAVVASGLAKPAIAAKEPITIGYLPALTGPSSSTGIGITRGTQLAVAEINAAGGIDGRQLELVTRDTQSDPTKAVNAAAELTNQQQVKVVLGRSIPASRWRSCRCSRAPKPCRSIRAGSTA